MDSPLFDLVKKLASDHAFVLDLNRVVEKVVLGQCNCRKRSVGRSSVRCMRMRARPYYEAT